MKIESNSRSSAYINIFKHKLRMRHPRDDFCSLTMTSLMKTANCAGYNIRFCLTPQLSGTYEEMASPHLTQANVFENQHSRMLIKIIGQFLFSNLIKTSCLFIL